MQDYARPVKVDSFERREKVFSTCVEKVAELRDSEILDSVPGQLPNSDIRELLSGDIIAHEPILAVSLG